MDRLPDYTRFSPAIEGHRIGTEGFPEIPLPSHSEWLNEADGWTEQLPKRFVYIL